MDTSVLACGRCKTIFSAATLQSQVESGEKLKCRVCSTDLEPYDVSRNETGTKSTNALWGFLGM